MNRRIVLQRRPVGWVDESCFRIEACAEPECGPEDVRLQALYLSTDPYLRGRMNAGPSYAPGFELDRPIVSRVVARVLDSRNARFRPGDLVWGFLDWAERCVVPRGEGLHRIDPALGRASHFLSVLGMPGLTAWIGAIEIGRAAPGDTVYVSSAAGAVGQLAGQFARRAGARVVGSAGSAAKVDFLRQRCGFDAAFDHRSVDLDEALAEHCPRGIDLYFDNVGGEIFETALSQMKMHGRIACCGVVSTYDTASQPAHGPRGVPFLFVVKRLTMRGFIVSDFFGRRDAALAQLRAWVEDGRLKVIEDVVEGFENLPDALIGLLHGKNRGKRMVKID